MEATVAKIRGFVRRQLKGERVWQVGVAVRPTDVRVTLYTPDKPDRFTDEGRKGQTPIVEELERKLGAGLGRDAVVNVVQAPTAVAKYVRITPRKVRFVVDAIRGKSVHDALAILQFVPNSAAKTVSKLIQSAAANAENNHRMDPDALQVMHVHVDDGPSLKRISPRAMGRAYRILKRTSHITVGLAEGEKPARVERRGKDVARTVGKSPRRGTAATAEAAKPKRTRKASPAPTAEAGEPQATQQPEGGQ